MAEVRSPEVAAAPPATSGPVYVGLITRAIAFVIDGALILAVALLVAVSAVVIVGVLHLPDVIDAILAVLGGAAYIAWSIGYFVGFWSTTGQTPGARVMQIRVVSPNGALLRPGRAIVRCIGLVLAALPLFAGFVPILFDRRRRGFQDWLAPSVVIRAPQVSFAAARRARSPRPTAQSARAPARERRAALVD
ncbi:MAG: RDD family protein [Solirubrobacteraceae bacterium]